MSPAYLVKLMVLITAVAIATAPTSECHKPSMRSLLSESSGQNKEKLTHLHFYFHDRLQAPNITTVLINNASSVGAPGTLFGQIAVTDAILTEGPDIHSRFLGRGQGMYSSSSIDSLTLAMVVNYVFLEGKYNGSYISVVGMDAATDKVRELSIVGGGGAFRLARGYVQFKTYAFDMKKGFGIVECDFYVYHY